MSKGHLEKPGPPDTGSIEKQEVRALIRLLDDPDPFIKKTVTARLSVLKECHVPILDEIRVEIRDESHRAYVTELIHDLTIDTLEQSFLDYLDLGLSGIEQLEKGQLLLCLIDNPTLRMDLYRRQLDKMASRLEKRIHPDDTDLEKISVLASFFFREELFKGADDDYMNPDNFFIHKVLQRRKGIPITLSMIMLFVANRLDLPLYGVNMPMHFLIKWEADGNTHYMDPFNQGRIVSLDQCSFFLRSHGVEPLPRFFKKATAADMMGRSLRNLIYSFDQAGRAKRVAELKRFLKHFETSCRL